MADPKDLTYAEVWKKLSVIDVNEHTKERTTMTYLSWAYAWAEMMKHYPERDVVFHGEQHEDGKNPDVFLYPGGTAMVGCTVTIRNLSRTMWLPVMTGFKNLAVANPDTRAIGDGKMRCLVKCFALLGLGFYIYAGEDLPPQEEKKKEKPKVEEKPKQDEETEEKKKGYTPTPAALIRSIKELGIELKENGTEVDDELRARIKAAIKSKESEELMKLVVELGKLQG